MKILKFFGYQPSQKLAYLAKILRRLRNNLSVLRFQCDIVQEIQLDNQAGF